MSNSENVASSACLSIQRPEYRHKLTWMMLLKQNSQRL